jgi:hypothetical protein
MFAASYLIFSVTGWAKAVPVGPKSYAVSGIRLGSGCGFGTGITVSAVAAPRASAGTCTTAFPPAALTVPPEGVMKPPSLTVIAAVPTCPSLVAVMLATPGETAFTIPVTSTEAIAETEEFQTTLRPLNRFPDASLGVANSRVVCCGTSEATPGVSVTLATGAGGGGGGGVGLELPPPQAVATMSGVIQPRNRDRDCI